MSVKCPCDSLDVMLGDLPPGHAPWICVAVVIIVFLSPAHSLVEIRVRSLRNVVSKLQLSLVSPADLVQERQLFINLLHWFNFPEVPLQEEVLQLINTLSTHPTGALMLRDVGGVDFLTQLSSNVDPQLRTITDAILDQLFHLHIYPPNTSSDQQSSSSFHPVEENAVRGYFQQNALSQTNAAAPPSLSVNTSVRCFTFSVFPWLCLTATDRHILSSNESSLRSDNPDLVRTTCELLRDVIMQDFPAEIFLQRPSIVQNLVQLLSVSSENDSSSLALHALACLQQLCGNLKSRLRFHRDPSFCSAKHDALSQNSSTSYPQEVRGTQRSGVSTPEDLSPRPSVLGRPGLRVRGDGQDGDAASTSSSSSSSQREFLPGPNLELDGEDPPELRVQQWNMARFCVETLQHTLPLLRTEKMKVFQKALELLSDILALLRVIVSPHELWEECSITANELRENLRVCMEKLGDIMCHHRHLASSEQPDSTLIHHRMSYMGTSVFTVRLLQTLLPVEKASENIPESTASAVFHLCLDFPFSLSFPSIHESAVAYLEQSNSENHSLYCRVSQAANTMEATCSFLKEVQAEGEKNWLELLELAGQAIDGFPYHQHLPLIKEFIHICSYLWKSAQASPLLQMESQKILLKLLSHPLLPVKAETYACTLDVVKECLGVHNVSRPASSICSGVHFLFHPRVLYEISAFGLHDPAKEVNSAAKDLLLYLLKGRLMMTALSWSKFNEALYPVIPVLQSHVGTEDALESSVLLISGLSDEIGDTAHSSATRLRAVIRLLFTKQHAVRSTAAQHLSHHLANSEDNGTSRLVVDSSTLSSLPSLYVTDKCVDVRLDDSNKSYLKVDCMNKLYSIFTSETVDMVLRKSAAEQLAVVLQDTAMHAVLKTQGLTDKLVSLITESVTSRGGSVGCLSEPGVTMLRKLVYADPSLRHTLAQQPAFLLALLRASLLMKANQRDVTEAAVLMCFLLFDEIAAVDVCTGKADTDTGFTPFSLPVCIIRRYNLPFRAASHHAVSPNCIVLPLYTDLMELRAAKEALSFSWNRAWHCGTDTLLIRRRDTTTRTPEFHADLVMSESQVASVRACDMRAGLHECVNAIRSAGSHTGVTFALTRIHLYLLTDQLAVKHDTHSAKSTLQKLGWRGAVERFLQVKPACPEDEVLLADVISFLNTFFRQHRSDSDDRDLKWLLELLLKKDTRVLLDLLLDEKTHMDPQRHSGIHHGHQLQRDLTSLFNTLLRLTHISDRMCTLLSGPLASEFAVRLLQCLRVSDAPRFYGLPSLGRSLRSMTHTTALPGWSTHTSSMEPHTLCRKYLSGLLEVISSFYVEWGGNAMSFMGKGVTKNAVISLLHLSHEMMSESKEKDWMSLWSLGPEQSADDPCSAQFGLAWLIPLWVDRDPEVRCASLALGAALSSLESGCVMLSNSCQNISGGLWATLLNILLERQECSMVCREAAFLLQNLLVMPMPANTEEAKDCFWQSPCVHDEATGVSLVGLPALQALLYHCHFFDHVGQMVRSCYTGRYTPTHPWPISVSADVDDSVRQWRGSTAVLNHTQGSGSISTSSTLLLSDTRSPVLSSSVAAQEPPFNRLGTQGQSDSDSSDSRVSQECVEGSDSISVVTPHLLSAVCGLLTNLLCVLPEFTHSALLENHILQGLLSVLDAAELERCLTELNTPDLLPSDVEDSRSQVLRSVCYVQSVCKLVQADVVHSEDCLSQSELIKPLLNNLISILTLSHTHLDSQVFYQVFLCISSDVHTQNALLHTWTDVFMLLAILLRRNYAACGPHVCGTLGKLWQRFSDTIRACVDQCGADPSLYTVSAQFLCVVFSEEAKKRGTRLERSASLTAALNSQSGEQLCELLLEYDKTPFQNPLKKVTAKVLMPLLACSSSAQSYACKAGLIDSCVEQMKQIHSQLHLESVRQGKTTHRKKEENSRKELRMVLEILRNCLYQHKECKEVATDLKLSSVVLSLWPWLLLNDPGMIAALELLCVYTANCTAACSAVCGSSVHAALPRNPVTNTLMHAVMKLASQVPPDNNSVHALSFSLLANLSISRDCRGLLQKSNFLQHFLSLPMPRVSSKGSTAAVVLSQWLQLLLNISFEEDGQQMIMKMRGALEMLTDLAQGKHGDQKRTSLLILHNICFCSANKPQVLVCDKAVELLVSCLESSSLNTRALGASALWALLHNYQKAKVTLKCPSIRLKVDGAYTLAKKGAEPKTEENTNIYLLKCLEHLSRLLNT
ncbi:rotatin isoform X3 [Ictalurus furcatus]|uniref:rotatin isoform X3 n=2 Tax=Ictalurus furcatus TaxID=66913 RepID=UPI0023500046|nr:rotatin isoform X3 [Ictalurus furcatus]